MKNVLGVVGIVAMFAMMVIAKVAPAEVRFWYGFFPMGIIVSIVIGAFVGAWIDALGRWGSSIVLLVATAGLLIGTQIASQDLASKADDLKGNYEHFYPILRGLVWWVCSTMPMIAGTVSAWRRSGQKKA